MLKKDFSDIRHILGKSQHQMAELLGISVKAVQSFEQGWRKVPVYVERQLLFLLYLKNNRKNRKPCWVQKKCAQDVRDQCPTWEYRAHDLCWFINGTVCGGMVQKNWRKKISICRKCSVFQNSIDFRF